MLLDSYSWIEFFKGSGEGEKVERILRENRCSTSIVSISEIKEWALRNKLDSQFFIDKVEKLSSILNLNREIVILAGKVNFENKKKIKNWGMLDSFIYATALTYNLSVLTGDNHFKNLTSVEML